MKAALEELRAAAQGTQNLLPPMKEALRRYATLGEVSDVLRDEFGVYQPALGQPQHATSPGSLWWVSLSSASDLGGDVGAGRAGDLALRHRPHRRGAEPVALDQRALAEHRARAELGHHLAVHLDRDHAVEELCKAAFNTT